MTIKYTTEGRVQIDCINGNAKPVALIWLKGGTVAKLCTGDRIIELSKSQLERIAYLSRDVSDDLIHSVGVT